MVEVKGKYGYFHGNLQLLEATRLQELQWTCAPTSSVRCRRKSWLACGAAQLFEVMRCKYSNNKHRHHTDQYMRKMLIGRSALAALEVLQQQGLQQASARTSSDQYSRKELVALRAGQLLW